MTFEIVDLTDHGDRQYKTKADITEDKKWIGHQGEKLITMLEDVIKGFK